MNLIRSFAAAMLLASPAGAQVWADEHGTYHGPPVMPETRYFINCSHDSPLRDLRLPSVISMAGFGNTGLSVIMMLRWNMVGTLDEAEIVPTYGQEISFMESYVDEGTDFAIKSYAPRDKRELTYRFVHAGVGADGIRRFLVSLKGLDWNPAWISAGIFACTTKGAPEQAIADREKSRR